MRGVAGRIVGPNELTAERAEEIGACYANHVYFVHNYCKIYDSVEKDWIPFHLWPAQEKVLHDIHNNQQTVILKARQLGITWLSLCYGLWTIIFRPIASVAIFSRREPEAIYMLGDERLRGIYDHLPPWMKSGLSVTSDAVREWSLSNGSVTRAFPTSAGDSYVNTLAIVDEADLAPDLNFLMGAVKPTIQAGGKLILLSRSNKKEPNSEFKRIYRGAKAGESNWYPVFLPWMSHPSRSAEWYDAQRRDILSSTGSLDDLHEQYPATDAEALSARTQDKRIPPLWLEACFEERPTIRVKGSPSLSNLHIYIAPRPGGRYVIGADPAEGNPGSDDSALTVLDLETGEEVASFAAKVEPAVFAHYLAQISTFYNFAPALVERNNHGHSVLQWLDEHARRTRLLLGHDADAPDKKKRGSREKRKQLKHGWLTSTLGKTIMYTNCTEFFRENARYDRPELGSVKVLHNLETFNQLTSIEVATLKAPEGDHDDRATSFALAVCARIQIGARGHSAGMAMATTKGWGM